IERAYVVDSGSRITLDALPAEVRGLGVIGAAQPDGSVRELSYREAKQRFVQAFERSYVRQVLAQADGNVSRAARIARLHRQAFQRLINRHEIDRDEFVPGS